MKDEDDCTSFLRKYSMSLKNYSVIAEILEFILAVWRGELILGLGGEFRDGR